VKNLLNIFFVKNVIINATLNLNLLNICRLLDIKTWYCVKPGKTRYESWIEETINVIKIYILYFTPNLLLLNLWKDLAIFFVLVLLQYYKDDFDNQYEF
jgi:hypothetical protein